jgi:hypothetical protein
MVAKTWSNRNAHSWLVEMQNVKVTSEDTVIAMYKTKYILFKYLLLFLNWQIQIVYVYCEQNDILNYIFIVKKLNRMN